MPIATLEAPLWSGTTRVDQTITEPSWVQVEAAIRQLDQASRQDVYLFPVHEDRETWLCIGGGKDEHVITGSHQGEIFPTFAGGSETGSVRLLTIGGQVGEYPSNWIVPLSTALSVANAFFEAGGFDCGINWKYG